ncbi:MAG TPA: plasmid pRiA4b ORF-3 family protein [Gammaproteobacteria bacterium]|nr:plasmid pRiA4b ORF-3 family protein [Gammaproteobacteria bacterium]
MLREVLELRVQLQYIEPPIWRRLRIRSSATLAGLHDAIQAAMGWSDSHLYVFFISRVGRISAAHPAKRALRSPGRQRIVVILFHTGRGTSWPGR